MKKLFFLVFVLFFFLIVFSCKKSTTTPNVAPIISYGSFTMADNQNAVITFNFSDADGDIGLQQSDTTAYDFWMRFYYKNYKGNFVTYWYPFPGQPSLHTLIDSNIITYRIPYINNTSKVKSLNGQIIINLYEYRPPPLNRNPNDSLNHFKYEFWIYDRAGHKSNVVTTPEFDTPYY